MKEIKVSKLILISCKSNDQKIKKNPIMEELYDILKLRLMSNKIQ